MVPHERSLVQRLENQPFALLGVNSDGRERYLAAVKEGGITWRNWFDGGEVSGPIASQWNVHLWPTIYVLDGKGIIRYKGTLQGEELDKAVDQLLVEMKDAAPR